MPDSIVIAELELSSRIGITAEERRTAQRLAASLVLEPENGFAGLEDRLERTVDYAAVCEAVKGCAASGERNLIETLAEDIADLVLGRFPVGAVEVEVRKFILPDTRHVAARLRRLRTRTRS